MRPAHLATRALFLRLLGVVYLIAFVSLWVQVHGLIGQHGILPASDYLQRAAAQLGAQSRWLLPTLGWWVGAGDASLTAICAAGTGAALLLICGVVPALALALLWALYLSLCVLGQDFLSFQWDVLLLEVGFLALFVTPGASPWPKRVADLLCPDPGREQEPPRAGLLLLRWTLLRFMLMSGAVKLLSGDRAWHDLTALQYHYQTQPLPPWTAWYAHHLPAAFQRASCAAMFIIELGVPLLILAPRRWRAMACVALVLLQLLIAATGNYTFFNLLTVVLCIPLLDDALLARAVPRRWRARIPAAGGDADPVGAPASGRTPHPLLTRLRGGPLTAAAVVVFALGGLQTTRALGVWDRSMSGAEALLDAIAPLRTINSYGLFAVMTTQRPEIVLEGSDDGLTWQEYGFRWKPGALERRPAFVAPHQPRLDWQMWFAALGDYHRTPWLASLLERLLQGSPEVLSLLGANPFAEHPPRFVRAVLYEYRFTSAQERRVTGAWWSRQLLGAYSPALSLRTSAQGTAPAASNPDWMACASTR